jgi:hypothetical protein
MDVNSSNQANLQRIAISSIRNHLRKRKLHGQLNHLLLQMIPNNLSLEILCTNEKITTHELLDPIVLSLFSELEIDSFDYNRWFMINSINIDSVVSRYIRLAFIRIKEFTLKNISLEAFTDYGIAHLCSAFPMLTNINFSGCLGLTEASLDLLNAVPDLMVLNIEYCDIVIKNWKLKSSTLRSLHVGCNSYSEDVLLQLSQSCPNLSIFSMFSSRIRAIADDDNRSHIHPLTLSAFQNVTRLDIRYVWFQNEFMLEAMSQLRYLKSVDASFSDVSDNFIIGLSTCAIDALSVRNTKITYRGLISIIESYAKSLDKLSLASTHLRQYSGYGDEIAWSFARFTRLSELDLNNTMLYLNSAHTEYYQRDENFSLFPYQLRYLDISNARLLDNLRSASIILAESIGRLSLLEALYLQGLRFSDRNWATLLSHKSRLKALDAAHTNLNDELFKSHIIPQMKRLRYLAINNTMISRDFIWSRNFSSKIFPQLIGLKYADAYSYVDPNEAKDNDLELQARLSGRGLSNPKSELANDHIADQSSAEDDEEEECLDYTMIISREEMLALRHHPATKFLSPGTQAIKSYTKSSLSLSEKEIRCGDLVNF